MMKKQLNGTSDGAGVQQDGTCESDTSDDAEVRGADTGETTRIGQAQQHGTGTSGTTQGSMWLQCIVCEEWFEGYIGPWNLYCPGCEAEVEGWGAVA